ncbi:MAG: uracil-DNA glycosylase family protein [Pseudomonadota bacterium]
MLKKSSFSKRLLHFYADISHSSFDLDDEYRIINPYQGNNSDLVKEIMQQFYQKFYDDDKPRRLIIGSSPSRRASGVIGIPFEDTKHLSELGIYIDNFYITKSSSGFLYDVMTEYGGCEKFYGDFYMNFAFPLCLVKIKPNGNEVNCNYYESQELKNILNNFIVKNIRAQVDLGIDTSVCYCIGSGGNYHFLSGINNKYGFFNKIIPLEHPRYIMQYHSKDKNVYLNKYLDALNKC